MLSNEVPSFYFFRPFSTVGEYQSYSLLLYTSLVNQKNGRFFHAPKNKYIPTVSRKHSRVSMTKEESVQDNYRGYTRGRNYLDSSLVAYFLAHSPPPALALPGKRGFCPPGLPDFKIFPPLAFFFPPLSSGRPQGVDGWVEIIFPRTDTDWWRGKLLLSPVSRYTRNDRQVNPHTPPPLPAARVLRLEVSPGNK